MRHEQFRRLSDNIRRDGALTSVPLAARQEDGSLVVLSGNHRVLAAIDGLGADYEADVMVIEADWQSPQAIALQLSHNSVVGQDDQSILVDLYEQLEDVDWREYSGLDDAVLDLLTDASLAPLSEASLEYQTLAVAFLPHQADIVKRVMGDAVGLVEGADEAWLARYDDHSRMLDAMLLTGAASHVRNVALQFAAVLDVFDRHRDDLADELMANVASGRQAGWVPVTIALGSDSLPAGLVARLARTLKDLGPDRAAGLTQVLDTFDDARG
jgi:hypothetical protein